MGSRAAEWARLAFRLKVEDADGCQRISDRQPMTDHSERHGTVHVRRPSPSLVREIGRRLSETVDEVRYPALVAAIQCETGCSRATAYRAVRDFVEQLETSH